MTTTGSDHPLDQTLNRSPMDRVKVLLVDDDEDDFLLTRSLLQDIDRDRFEVAWMPNYDQALKRVLEGGFDVCLIDFRLGGHTGLDLLRAVRDAGCETPVILMTGQGGLEVDFLAMRSGAADYLVKGEMDAALLERSIRYAIQQRRIEEERIRRVREQEKRAQAEAANRAKDEFLAMVSHELRTPLHAVLGWVTLLGSGKLEPADQARAVEIIERNTRAQAQIIDDLLDLSRITSGTLRLQLQPVELAPIVEKATEAVHPAMTAKSIRFTVELESGPVQVDGDAGRLQQILLNLLSNAVKFTPEGGEIEVRLQGEGDRVRVLVRDSGNGLSREQIARVFERFYQAEGAQRPGGLGLGLAIARHLVEAHGGTIRAESPGMGQGATFSIDLPVLARPARA